MYFVFMKLPRDSSLLQSDGAFLLLRNEKMYLWEGKVDQFPQYDFDMHGHKNIYEQYVSIYLSVFCAWINERGLILFFIFTCQGCYWKHEGFSRRCCRSTGSRWVIDWFISYTVGLQHDVWFEILILSIYKYFSFSDFYIFTETQEIPEFWEGLGGKKERKEQNEVINDHVTRMFAIRTMFFSDVMNSLLLDKLLFIPLFTSDLWRVLMKVRASNQVSLLKIYLKPNFYL